jgi:hypothetical protein
MPKGEKYVDRYLCSKSSKRVVQNLQRECAYKKNYHCLNSFEKGGEFCKKGEKFYKGGETFYKEGETFYKGGEYF